MTIHTCKYCDFTTSYLTNYNVHLKSNKHKNNIAKQKPITNQSKDISNNLIEKVIQQNEELKKEIQKLKETSNQNTHKIVTEARVIKKSILSMLNSDYKDTPSIDYIKEDEFREEFEEEYNFKLDDKDNRLFMRIFSDFKKRKLIGSLSNVIVRIIKKEDQKKQSVFNIDAARGNYATKIQDIWHNDKKGLQLKKYTIDVVTKYMINIMDIFRERLVDMYNENKIKKNINVTDYIMEYRGLLLDVNAFLTNPNTHKRIILELCPELRFDEKYLE
jgi:glutaredoxin